MRSEPSAWGRLARLLAAGVLLAVAAALVLPLVGSARLDYGRALAGLSLDKEILFYARLPRVLMALVAGGALAEAGVLFQALVRDALADPYVLGVAGGASGGAVLSICLGWTEWAGLSATTLSASAGAAAALFLVVAIATQGKRMSSFTLLLAGITINSISAAILLLLHNVADFSQSFVVMRWLMGSIERVSYRTLAWLTAVVLATVVYLFARARDWNLLAVGEEWATARGLVPSRAILAGFCAGSVITGCVTALAGPIAFLGLIVPHALRLRLGADHRLLIPCAFFGGGVFLALCDTLARTALAPAEIPVGVITALLGGPFFIWLLRSRRRSLWL